MSLATLTPVNTVAIDRAAVLRALKLDPASPQTQALLLVCDRYGLDPLLKHMVLISGNPYVTRDGYLHVAHASGVFDGMEVTDEGTTDSHWWAKVSVYRKDMTRPFSYTGRYPKSGQMSAKYGPEMAIKCAEVMALRRAFDVTGIGAADEQWDAITVEAIDPATEDARDELTDLIGTLSDDAVASLKLWWKNEDLPPLGRLDADQIRYVAAEVDDLCGIVDDRRPDDGGPVAATTGHATVEGGAAELHDAAPPLTVKIAVDDAPVQEAGTLPAEPAGPSTASEGVGAVAAAPTPPKRTPARKATAAMRSRLFAVLPEAFPMSPEPGPEAEQNKARAEYQRVRLLELCAALGRPVESRTEITDDHDFCSQVIDTVDRLIAEDLYLVDGALVDGDGAAVTP